MQPIHIVGRKNHGKTTLLLEIVDALTRRGLCVGTIKHTRHAHELDARGKDSCRLREVGAAPSAIVSAGMAAVHFPVDPGGNFYAQLAPFFEACDLVLVEGHVDGPGPKLEVWREEIGGERLSLDPAAGVVAIVGEGEAPHGLPRLDRANVAAICDFILDLAAESAQSRALATFASGPRRLERYAR